MGQHKKRNQLCSCGSGKKFKKCCLKTPKRAPEVMIVDDTTPGRLRVRRAQADEMKIRHFEGVKIYRPNDYNELCIRDEFEAYVRARYTPGVHEDSVFIGDLLRYCFDYYSNKIEHALSLVASRNWTDFLLFQYDQTHILEEKRKGGKFQNPSDERLWRQIGPVYRRALKYLLECTTMIQPGDRPKGEEYELMKQMDTAVICAEQMVKIYILTEQTHHVFPADTRLTISRPGNDVIFVLALKTHKSDVEMFWKEQQRDTLHRLDFTPADKEHFPYDTDEHAQHLDMAFESSFGVSYHDCIAALFNLIENSIPADSEFGELLIKRSDAIEGLMEIYRISERSAQIILDGFSLRHADMINEGRVVNKPKQEYRAMRRAFFVMQHAEEEYLAFSKSMAQEAMVLLVSGVPLKKLPAEWASKSTRKAMEALSNNIGTWFEEIVEANFAQLGYSGRRSVKKIGVRGDYLKVPSEIGEIDYLGFRQGILVVVETKLISPGTEPRFFLDDKTKFLKKNGYVDKFSKKVEWAKGNVEEIESRMKLAGILCVDDSVQRVESVLITYYPTMISIMIPDIKCVSLANFMLDHQSHNTWPY